MVLAVLPLVSTSPTVANNVLAMLSVFSTVECSLVLVPSATRQHSSVLLLAALVEFVLISTTRAQSMPQLLAPEARLVLVQLVPLVPALLLLLLVPAVVSPVVASPPKPTATTLASCTVVMVPLALVCRVLLLVLAALATLVSVARRLLKLAT